MLSLSKHLPLHLKPFSRPAPPLAQIRSHPIATASSPHRPSPHPPSQTPPPPPPTAPSPNSSPTSANPPSSAAASASISTRSSRRCSRRNSRPSATQTRTRRGPPVRPTPPTSSLPRTRNNSGGH